MRLIEQLDREMTDVHKALATQLIRIGQIQQQIDELRTRLGKEAE